MTDDAPPEVCGVAFKEWEGVCEALAQGGQSIILRKGGIEEGAGGFVPEHPVFWLYPTAVHQAEQGLKSRPPAEWVRPTTEARVGLNVLAAVELIGRVDRPELLPALDDLHVWTAETVAKRFHYRTPGLWVLGVRIYRRRGPHLIAVTPEHAGCKTWVPLETPVPTSGLELAVEPSVFRDRMTLLRSILDPETPS